MCVIGFVEIYGLVAISLQIVMSCHVANSQLMNLNLYIALYVNFQFVRIFQLLLGKAL